MQACEEVKKEVMEVIQAVRAKKPLIECITNYVTIGDCANIVLAAGASPIMAEDKREIEEIVSAAGAVVLNIGTLQPQTVEAMALAGKKANELGVPVVLDPVGVGATKLRNDTAAMLCENVHFSVVRGNMSEIRALAGCGASTKGVDAGAGDAAKLDAIEESVKIVGALARKLDCCVAATGGIDVIAYSGKAYIVDNGHEMMGDVTGTGCMCSSVVGAYCGGGLKRPGVEALAAVLTMCIAGEKAHEYVDRDEKGIGTFREKLFDYVYTIGEKDIYERGKIYETSY